MERFTVKIGKSPDEMTFDECMVHVKRVLFWDYIDGEWCDVEILSDRRWEELAGYIKGAHEREVDALKAENERLTERCGRLFGKTLELANESDRLKRSAKLDDSTISALNACIDDLNAENFKLRGLVNDMWICVSHGLGWDCTGCRRDPDNVCIMGISEFSQRMRDLGIEADRECTMDGE